MFIKKIEIQDYRSCLKTSFDLDKHLSILIGPNASGKTNVMTAFLLLRKILHEESHYHFRHVEEKPTGRCKLKVSFELGGGKEIKLSSVLDIYTDDENDDVIVASKQKWYLKDSTGNTKLINVPLRLVWEFMRRGSMSEGPFFFHPNRYFRLRRHKSFPGRKEISILYSIAQFISDMKYYSASQFTNPSKCPVSFEIEKEGEYSRGVRLRGHSKFLFDLYVEKKSAERSKYNQFFAIVGPAGIKLIDKISFKEIQTSSIDYSVKSGGKILKKRGDKNLIIPKFGIGKNVLSPNQLSEGTFKTITLLFYLITERSSILLIEEPEVCVHHGLLSSIIELIKQYSADKQIIVSTHSDFVLDKVGPENVYKVTKKNEEGTKVTHIPKSMLKKEFSALKNYLDTEGNLGEYWKHGDLE